MKNNKRKRMWVKSSVIYDCPFCFGFFASEGKATLREHMKKEHKTEYLAHKIYFVKPKP